MRALSLWQPWATLVAIGAKTVETRSWASPYRGELAVHAAKKWTRDLAALCTTEPFRRALTPEAVRLWPDLPGDRAVEGRKALAQYLRHAGTPHGIPLGSFVARSVLNGCYRTERLLAPCVGCSGRGYLGDDAPKAGICPVCHGRGKPLADAERPFGDYSAGRYGWDLGPTVVLPAPIPARGQQGMWDLPEDLAHSIIAAAPMPWETAGGATSAREEVVR